MQILRREDVKQSERPPFRLHALSAGYISSGRPAAPVQGRKVRLIEIGLALSRDNERVGQLIVPDRRRTEKEAWAKVCAQA